jgi:hypothetical protein
MDDETRLLVAQQLLDERDRRVIERVEVRIKLALLAEQDRALASKLSDIRSAGRVFGQAIAVPIDLKDYESMEAIHAAMAKLRNNRPWEPGKSTPNLKPPDDAQGAHQEDPEGTRIKDRLLERLKLLTSNGSKAADLRNYLETTFGTKTHEKTVGMTLYRLSQDGLVRRDGRTWFFVPPKAETKNPGGSAPGSIEARSERKEGVT